MKHVLVTPAPVHAQICAVRVHTPMCGCSVRIHTQTFGVFA